MLKEIFAKIKNRKISKRAALIATVAISAVLIIAVVFAISGSTEKADKAKDMDKAASQIFVAAQNNLTQIKESGGLSEYDSKNSDGSLGAEIKKAGSGENSYYCLSYVPGGYVDLDNTILKDILPSGSLSSNIRTGGYYIIEYDFNNAQIKSVFYTDNKAGLNELTLNDDYRGNSKSAERSRRNYVTDNGGKAHVIGYCNGSGIKTAKARLAKPRLVINNGNKLTVTITDPNYYSTIKSGKGKTSLKTHVSLTVVGSDSGNTCDIDLTLSDKGIKPYNDKDSCWSVKTIKNGRKKSLQYEVTLDDITRSGCHFADLCPRLTPGEDIEVYATCSTTRAFCTSTTSNVGVSNSLFAQVVPDINGSNFTGTATAEISNIRHLENLDSMVSGLPAFKGASGSSYIVTSVYQSSDISWKSFSDGNTYIYGYNKDNKGRSRVLATNSYFGISNNNLTSYNGDGNKISGLVIMNDGISKYAGDLDITGDGLFRTISSPITVSNLTLEDFDVTAPENAGALVGEVNSTGLSGQVNFFNVLVKGGSVTASTNKGGNAGGLIGSSTESFNSLNIRNCGASAIVTSKTGNAGGLVGYLDSQASIENSYSGGHTYKGRYSKAKYNVTSGTDSIMTTSKKFAAGGLIGKVGVNGTSVSVRNCNSTCSVSGVNSGGIIGYDNSGNGAHSYSGCYGTGLISGQNAGAFGGMVKKISVDGSYYLSGINGKMKAFGKKVKVAGKVSKAGYYDSTLIARDNSSLSRETHSFDGSINGEKYPFIMYNSAGAENSTSTYAFYGDWQKPKNADEQLDGNLMFAYREGTRGNYHWKVLNAVATGKNSVSVNTAYNDLMTGRGNESRYIGDGDTAYGLLTMVNIETSSYYEKGEKVKIAGKNAYFHKVRAASVGADIKVTPVLYIKDGKKSLSFRYKFNSRFAAAMGKSTDWDYGTEDDPYQVRTAAQFESINDYRSASFWQSCDIRLHKKYSGAVIRGGFNGSYNATSTSGDKGYNIVGINEKVRDKASAGLFDNVSEKGSIVGLCAKGKIHVTLSKTIGNADDVVNIGGLTGSNKGSIRDSSADMELSVDERSSANVTNIGLLAGLSDTSGAFDGCSSEGTLNMTGKGSNYVRIGGLIGACNSAYIDVTTYAMNECKSKVDMNIDYNNRGKDNTNTSCIIGGLAGYLKGGQVKLCGSQSVITSKSTYNYIGGLIGYTGSYDKIAAHQNGTTIESCWAEATISSRAAGGWLSGFVAHTRYQKDLNTTIRNCYSATKFSSATKGTAILFLGGNKSQNTISNCYGIELDGKGNIVASQRTFSGGAALKKDSYCYTCANDALSQPSVQNLKPTEFGDISSFSNWDTGIWKVTNGKYPTLVEE